MKTFNVAIIGAGSIGALKEERLDNPNTNKPLTHAHAVYQDKRFSINLIIDEDVKRATAAAERWKCCGSFEFEPLNNRPADVIVVAANTKNHFNVLMNNIISLHNLPKLVITEKPFCWTSGEASIVSRFYEEQGIKLLVNYSRRYSKSYQKFFVDYISKEEVQQVTVKYNRGLKHDGCHALDIMNWWFGRCLDISLNKSIEPVLDYPEGGRTYCLSMKYEYCPSVVFIPFNYKDCGVFEIDIVTKKNRHIFVNFGEYIVSMNLSENTTYGQKNNLLWNVEPIYGFDNSSDEYLSAVHSATQTDLHYMLANLYDKVYEVLTSPKEITDGICTTSDAIRVHNIVEHVDMLYEKQTW